MDTPAGQLSRRWVLVAGTGLEHGLPERDLWAAQALGRLLARNRYGLVCNAWHGVDYLVTEAFVEELRRQELDPHDYLIVVVQAEHLGALPPGRVVRTPYGAREWLEPQKYADAVVLIGGLGGTYCSWLGALHGGLPRLPFGGTGGDAEAAFEQTRDLWELLPVPGITRDEFAKLGRPIDGPDDAEAVAGYIVDELLWRCLDAVDAVARKDFATSTSVFISYSRRDAEWIDRLRTLMRPAERRGLVSTWIDTDLRPGTEWNTEILDRLRNCNAALLMLSPNFLKSEYINGKELPLLRERIKDRNFRLLWALLEACDWQRIPELQQFQAIGGTEVPVRAAGNSADEQCRLIEIVDAVTATLSAAAPAPPQEQR